MLKNVSFDKPAEIINMQDYGTMNGAKVLIQLLKLGGKINNKMVCLDSHENLFFRLNSLIVLFKQTFL